MNASVILGGVILLFIIGYRTYGTFVARVLNLDDRNITPAHKLNDGVDYSPAPMPVVLGHHFATIAGAGPIVGPILAIYFGWLPALIWIIIGSVFIGAMHDFLSLTASMRHEGRSIGSIIELYVGKTGKKLFILFSFPALVLVIAVFMDVVVKTFVAKPAVGTASILFILLAIGFGFARNRFNAPLVQASIAGVILMALSVWAGVLFPLELGREMWLALVCIYIFFAAISPVSWLLQPRDYLNSFLLYGVMLMAVAGIFTYNPAMSMPAVTSFAVNGNYLFPILFVTVACGAISGFHSLAASGTTSKQVDKETDAKAVGYGAMLIEGVLAVVALITVAYLSPAMQGEIKGGPIAIFSQGVGTFASAIGVPIEWGITFAAMAISSFALTTLDSCVRLARFAFQEYFSSSVEELGKNRLVKNPVTGTSLAIGFGLLLAVSGGAKAIWPVFGSANQLLGALALLAGAIWLEKSGRESLFVKIPMVFMFGVSLSALAALFIQNIGSGNWLIAVISALLFGLAISLASLGYNSLKVFRKNVLIGEPVRETES
ncbi:MAG: carbon starvation protein A [Nitrospinota bacterium]|nr:carbon starvation protein A [Nitrospinota bacterium]